MGFDDAIRAEQRNRDLNQQWRDAENARWSAATTSAEAVLREFLGLMVQAGNPGLRTFKKRRGRRHSWLELLPARAFAAGRSAAAR